MGKQLTASDLTELRSMAISECNRVPARTHLPGMKRDLDDGERAAIGWISACISMLNRMGAIKEGWIEPVIPVIPLESFDNGVVVDSMQAFDLNSPKKNK